jgi:predicted AlkP superfamily pyrophosphatase or phosphodiesterase
MKIFKNIKTAFSLLLMFVVTASIAQDTTQQIVAGRFNSTAAQKKPYVILISIDGLRADFVDKYNATALQAFGSHGVVANYMTSSFPSLTFPNHYSIVTGLYPAHHGLVDNTFFDEKANATYTMSNKKMVADPYWYGGAPLWVLAEKQQMLTASFYWVASETPILNTTPTYYYYYNDKIKIEKRITQIKDWLSLPEKTRPHLITFYMPDVDDAAHNYGPDSKQAEAAVQYIDNVIGQINEAVSSLKLPVNFILVSDHGMALVNSQTPMRLPKAVDPSKFYVPSGSALLQLYAKDPLAITPTYQALLKEANGYDVYLKENMPKDYHYNNTDDKYNRIGDIVLVAKLPNTFSLSGRPSSPGKHGYDPRLTEMRASFRAWGPAFKAGKKINGFENIHVYPLVAKILGLIFDEKTIDGKLSVLKHTLK